MQPPSRHERVVHDDLAGCRAYGSKEGRVSVEDVIILRADELNRPCHAREDDAAIDPQSCEVHAVVVDRDGPRTGNGTEEDPRRAADSIVDGITGDIDDS